MTAVADARCLGLNPRQKREKKLKQDLQTIFKLPV